MKSEVQIEAEFERLQLKVEAQAQELESKNRELEIEAALEKVRSRSLSMHKSDELNEVVAVLFEKLKDLEIPFTAVGIATDIKDSKDLNAFVCGQNEAGLVITNYRLLYFKNPISKDLYNALEKQLDFFVGHYSKEEKDEFYHHLIEHTDEFKHLPEDILQMIFNSEAYCISMIAVKNAVFNINDFEGKSLAQHEIDIIKRFARVFEQAYTRFLDLQKAESQAREAQIEAALERVRSRSMAMHKSNELNEVATVLFQQIRQLGGNLWTCGIVLCQKDSEVDHFMVALENGMAPTIDIPNTKDPATKNMYNHWEKGANYYTEEAGGKDLKKHYDYLATLPTMKPVIENLKASGISLPTWQKWHAAYFSHGYLMIITLEPYPQEEVFKRFAKVFDQAYTRFLDLQKAEAQAREAQIEVALEKIRNRTLLMKDSSELNETVSVFFQQFDFLGLLPKEARTYFSHVDTLTDTVEVWMTHADGRVMSGSHITPLIESEQLKAFYTKWKQDRGIINTRIYQEEDLANYMAFLVTLPHVAKDEDYQKLFKSPPDQIVMTDAGFLQGFLGIMSFEPLKKEAIEILSRFAKAFEFTYTRFLDLQKAEAQTREAKIETALEKIRSRTMGMQSSDELPEVANLLFLEIQALGVPAWSCGYCILQKDQKSSSCIMSSEGTLQKPFLLPYYGEASFDEWNDFMKSDQSFFMQELGGKAIESHYNFMKSLPQLTPIFKEIMDAGHSLPTYQINHLCKFANGFLLFITYESVPEAHDIFKRFTKVFEQTYTRFLDLKKAEAQARESQIEAALERVRSRSMAMQHSGELNLILAKVFEELTNLELQMERAVIWIYYPESRSVRWWAANPEAESGTDSFLITNQDHPVYLEYWKYWEEKRTKQLYILEGENMVSWCDVLSMKWNWENYPRKSKKQ